MRHDLHAQKPDHDKNIGAAAAYLPPDLAEPYITSHAPLRVCNRDQKHPPPSPPSLLHLMLRTCPKEQNTNLPQHPPCVGVDPTKIKTPNTTTPTQPMPATGKNRRHLDLQPPATLTIPRLNPPQYIQSRPTPKRERMAQRKGGEYAPRGLPCLRLPPTGLAPN